MFDGRRRHRTDDPMRQEYYAQFRAKRFAERMWTSDWSSVPAKSRRKTQATSGNLRTTTVLGQEGSLSAAEMEVRMEIDKVASEQNSASDSQQAADAVARIRQAPRVTARAVYEAGRELEAWHSSL